ncbi:oligosaccharide flippase family protein [Luteimonas sp. TWI1416]|uniref:oligosaccharide flippase family protein n=1 Tax=unclassified Luteimonas TaxID=2629088 RepID=UPI00320B1CDA
MLDFIKRRLNQARVGGVARSIGVLVGGTAFAQALGVLALPVLTRLYTPADFGVLAVYTALLGILAVVASLRLEIAIPLPEADEEAANLLAVALCSSAAFGAALAIVVGFGADPISDLLDAPGLAPYLWLLPLGVWITGSYTALQYWTSRKKNFMAVARTRMSQAIGGTATQLGLGALGIAPLGLLLGQLIKSGAGVAGLGYRLWKRDRTALRAIRRRDMKRVAGEYQRFPKYSMLEALANTASIQVPILLIAANSPSNDAGHLLLAMQVLAIPAALIGQAVGQVFLSHASEHYRKNELAFFTARMVGHLIAAGIAPVAMIALLAPLTFQLIFGSGWERSGDLVAWMAPWFFMQFITSPVSMVLHVTGNQKLALSLQFFGFVLRTGIAAVAIKLSQDHVAEAHALSGAVFYFIYFVVVARVAHIDVQLLARAAPKKAIVLSLGGVVLVAAALHVARLLGYGG